MLERDDHGLVASARKASREELAETWNSFSKIIMGWQVELEEETTGLQVTGSP